MDRIDLEETDLEALRRALKIAKSSDRGRRQQIESMLEDRPWQDVAEFASFCCQAEALRLRPWQTPPCWVGDERPLVDDHRGEVAAWELRRRLLAAGLSQYEPDPVRMLEAVAMRQRSEPLPKGGLEEVH